MACRPMRLMATLKSIDCISSVLTLVRIPIKEEYWAETYVSAVLRSLHYSDDLTYRLEGLRYFNIIPDLDSEVRFFESVEQLFWKGGVRKNSLLPVRIRSRDRDRSTVCQQRPQLPLRWSHEISLQLWPLPFGHQRFCQTYPFLPT